MFLSRKICLLVFFAPIDLFTQGSQSNCTADFNFEAAFQSHTILLPLLSKDDNKISESGQQCVISFESCFQRHQKHSSLAFDINKFFLYFSICFKTYIKLISQYWSLPEEARMPRGLFLICSFEKSHTRGSSGKTEHTILQQFCFLAFSLLPQ